MDKEILYLNNSLVNSLLAQHNGGLVSGVSSEESSGKAKTKGNTTGGKISTDVSAEASAGLGKILSRFDANIKGDIGGETSLKSTRETALSEGQKDIINKQFHDYSLNILLDDLAGALKDNLNVTEIGDIIQ